MQTSAQRCAQFAVVSWLWQLVDLPGSGVGFLAATRYLPTDLA